MHCYSLLGKSPRKNLGRFRCIRYRWCCKFLYILCKSLCMIQSNWCIRLCMFRYNRLCTFQNIRCSLKSKLRRIPSNQSIQYSSYCSHQCIHQDNPYYIRQRNLQYKSWSRHRHIRSSCHSRCHYSRHKYRDKFEHNRRRIHSMLSYSCRSSSLHSQFDIVKSRLLSIR